jgi:hypothetical protein
MPSNCPLPLAGLMEQCWAEEPSSRPAFEHLVEMLAEQAQVYYSHGECRPSCDGEHDQNVRHSSVDGMRNRDGDIDLDDRDGMGSFGGPARQLRHDESGGGGKSAQGHRRRQVRNGARCERGFACTVIEDVLAL